MTSNTVEVFELPDAGFEITKDATKSSISLHPDDVNLAEYNRNFGDGSISTEVSPEHTYEFNDSYQVMLEVVDENGCTAFLVDFVDITVSIANIEEVMEDKVDAYPNPFNAQATIFYTLDKQMVVSGALYELQGRMIFEHA